MPVISKLSALLTLNQKGFTAGLRKATARVRGFSRTFTSRAAKLSGLVSGGAFALLLRNQFNMVEATQLVADKLGIQINRLIELQFAAKNTGIRAETLNMALQRMVRRVSEAAIGTGEAKGAIAELGLSASQLARMAPDKIIRQLAESFSRVRSQADKVRLAFKLFDSEGVSMVNLLGAGARQLDHFAERARALGLVVSESMSRRIMQFNQTMNELGALLTGVVRRGAIALSGPLKLLIDQFILATDNGKTFRNLVITMIERVTTAILQMGRSVSVTMAMINDWFNETNTAFNVWAGWTKTILGTASAFLQLRHEMRKLDNERVFHEFPAVSQAGTDILGVVAKFDKARKKLRGTSAAAQGRNDPFNRVQLLDQLRDLRMERMQQQRELALAQPGMGEAIFAGRQATFGVTRGTTANQRQPTFQQEEDIKKELRRIAEAQERTEDWVRSLGLAG